MNISTFDLPFLLALLYLLLFGPGPSLPFSLFTHFPLAHHLIQSRTFLFTPALFSDLFLLLLSLILSRFLSTVKSKPSPSKLELSCLYSEWSQIQSAKWTYQDKSRKLHVVSSGPGRITAVLPTPITADTAGNYTCTLQMNNGQTVWATEAVALPSKGMKKALAKTGCILRETMRTSAQLSRDNDLGSASPSVVRSR